MSRHIALAAALLAAAFAAGCQSSQKAATTVESAAQAQTTPSLSTTDATFINTVGGGGIAEVKFGQLAQSRATRGDIRQFAAQMVTDHSAANQELTTLAQGKKMTPPTDMDLTHRRLYDKLSAMTGTAFDQTYMESQVQDHTAVVAAFQNEISNGSDPDIKAFAQKHLPTIQHHLDMARTIAAQ